jgi:hypothetical protein
MAGWALQRVLELECVASWGAASSAPNGFALGVGLAPAIQKEHSQQWLCHLLL